MVRLLIVEDHPELASLMVAAAESRGHEATAVHTGEAALALLRPAAFHAAVVDLLLPDMRGSTVLTALRDHAIPAVAVSGVFKGERFAREATELHGARAFFEKPFELGHLLGFIEELCGLSPLSEGPGDQEGDEVLVFEDASLMDMEDEPGFSAAEDDEPLFGAPADESPPVVQGLTLVEEAEDPLGVEPLELPPSLEVPEPEPSAPYSAAALDGPEPLWDEPAAEAPVVEAPAARPKTPTTLSTVELGALALEEEEAVPPAPESRPPETLEVPPATLATMAVSAEEFAALEALGDPAPEPPPVAAEPPPPAAEEPPVEAPPAVEVPLTMAVSVEEFAALDALDAPAPEPTPEPAPAPTPEPAPEPEPGIALPFGDREKVWSKKAETEDRRRAPPAWSLSGDLHDTSVPRLLNAYYEARHSGELKLRQGSLQKVIYFEAGRPVYAASNLTQERFLRFCVRRGVLSEAQAQQAATLAREQNLRSSEALEKLGWMDAPARQKLVEEQVKEIIWSTLAWTQGAYGFSLLKAPRAGRVKLSVFPGDLVLEGTLRTESLVALRQRMPHARRLFPTAAPPYGLHELTLKGQQALVLAYADGSKTVEDLLTLTDLHEREVLATLRGLELIGVLEERREEPLGNSRRISFGL
ncbi:response regulator [Archangium primigenium]|uniref:response regulator n=1 Tax=[Archangium] primigenium TaxID=2792470 RepID=UPI001EF82D66|nr:response regulator [Archangium primigenium]